MVLLRYGSLKHFETSLKLSIFHLDDLTHLFWNADVIACMCNSLCCFHFRISHIFLAFLTSQSLIRVLKQHFVVTLRLLK
jgi:hypothetical protein